MLVLARNEQESVIVTVGEERVVVTVVDISGAGGGRKRVRLGFTAPKHVAVHRAEIQARVDAGLAVEESL